MKVFHNLLQLLQPLLNKLFQKTAQYQRYRNLCEQYREENKRDRVLIFNLELEALRSKNIIADLKRKVERNAEKDEPTVEKDLTTEDIWYNDIEKPKFNLAALEKALTKADKFTMRRISDYLKLDSYELVKNMAKITNKGNASEVIAHRDWALQRNENLIRILDRLSVEKVVKDKLTGEDIVI